MPKSKSRSRNVRKALWITGILSGLILTGLYFVNDYLSGYLSDRISEANDKENINITCGETDVNIFTGSASFYNITLGITAESNKYDIRAQAIRVKHFSIWRFLKNKQIYINSLEVLNPHINIKRTEKAEIKKGEGKIPDLKIANTYLYNAELFLNNSEGKDSFPSMGFKKASGHIENFSLSPTDSGTVKAEYFISLVTARDLKIITKNGMYEIGCPFAVLNNKEGLLLIDSLALLPLYPGKAFFKKSGKQTDRITVKSDRIVMNYKPVYDFRKDLHAESGRLFINRLSVVAQRDKNYPHDGKIKPTVQQLLSDSPLNFSVKRTYIKDSYIRYEEQAEGADKPGKIWFDNMNALLTGIKSGKPEDTLFVTAEAELFSSGKMEAELTFLPRTTEDAFLCTGKLRGIEFEDLNPILKENLNVYLTDGKLKRLDFNFIAGEKKSNGRMMLIYEDLRMAAIDKKSGDTTALDEKLKSVLANTILLNKNNSIDKNKGETILEADRDSSRFIFNYAWKTILSGLKKTLVPLTDTDKKKNKPS